jgi:hypothetical protein
VLRSSRKRVKTKFVLGVYDIIDSGKVEGGQFLSFHGMVGRQTGIRSSVNHANFQRLLLVNPVGKMTHVRMIKYQV